MSLTDLEIVIEKDDVLVMVLPPPTIAVQAVTIPDMHIIMAGNVGPPGPQGKWVSMTQAEYDALSVHDPDTLYVIVL